MVAPGWAVRNTDGNAPGDDRTRDGRVEGATKAPAVAAARARTTRRNMLEERRGDGVKLRIHCNEGSSVMLTRQRGPLASLCS